MSIDIVGDRMGGGVGGGEGGSGGGGGCVGMMWEGGEGGGGRGRMECGTVRQPDMFSVRVIRSQAMWERV